MLHRRKALTLFGAIGTGIFAVGVSRKLDPIQPQANNPVRFPGCMVRPEQTEGPYFVDERLNRSDIRFDSTVRLVSGVPLQIEFRVSQVSDKNCIPLSGVLVDIWHCNAEGIYSDVIDRNFNTISKRFLRGYQVTEDGIAKFTTIYPGWYPGRTTHIHFKIRTNTASGESYQFTSQMYFDDLVTDQVYKQPPYVDRGERQIRNAEDGIFRNGGEELLLALTETAQGYTAIFDIGLEMV